MAIDPKTGKSTYFTNWHPLTSLPIYEQILSNKKKVTIYRHQFQTDGDISIWQLRHRLYWLAPVDNILAQSLGAAVGGIGAGSAIAFSFPMTGVQIVEKPGEFEYKIEDPGGNVIFHCKVTICLQLIIMTIASGLGLIMSDGIVIPKTDSTTRVSSVTVPAPPNSSTVVTTPALPVVRNVLDDNGQSTTSVKISYGSPVPLASGGFVDKMYVERNVQVLDGGNWVDEDDKNPWKQLEGEMTVDPDSVKTTTLTAGLTDVSKEVIVNTTNGFPDKGTLDVQGEKIGYLEKSLTTFRNITRGMNGTVAQSHPNGAQVSDGGSVIYEKIDTGLQWSSKRYLYRIKGVKGSESASGPGTSILIYNRLQCRTIIETYVINGQKTEINPTLTPYDTFITQSQLEANYVSKLSPGKREEIISVQQYPPDMQGPGFYNGDWTITGGNIITIDGWADMPIYEFKIPNGSILHVVRDGFSTGALTSKGRGAEWLFRYHITSVLWGILSDISGRMMQAQVADGSVYLVDASNSKSDSPITSNRVRTVFANGSGAFIFKTKAGDLWACICEAGVNKLYLSRDGGRSFSPDPFGNEQPPLLFDGNKNYNILDMTKDENEAVYVLAENGNELFLVSSKDSFDAVIWVGTKKSNNKYVFQGYESDKNVKEMTISGTEHSFISSDYGRKWEEVPFKFETQSSLADLRQYPVIDSSRTNKGMSLNLKDDGSNLFLQVGDLPGDNVLQVGPKVNFPSGSGRSGQNKYKLQDNPDFFDSGHLIVQGESHNYVTNNGGKTWNYQEVVQGGDD